MISLALKYRPATFNDLVGQLHAAKSLKNAIEFDKISHAYLFFGSRGVGKTSTARILAKSLNCLTNGPSTTPCGECDNCLHIPKGNSMDVIEMDAASNRGIDTIRELRENAKFAPMKSKYKIYIIDEVHMLTNESFNALLKTLEEPPPHVIFIMATTEYHKIPETILSRCQSFAFKKFSNTDIKKRLTYILDQEQILFEEDAILPIAQKGEGSLRDSISLLDQVIAFVGKEKISMEAVRSVLGIIPQELFVDLLIAIHQRNTKPVLIIIDKLASEGQNLKVFIWHFLTFIKDAILIKENCAPDNRYSQNFLDSITKATNTIDIHELSFTFDNLYKMYNQWSLFQTTKASEIQISLEVSMVELIRNLSQPSISNIMQKIQGIANAIETGKTFTDEAQSAIEASPSQAPPLVATATKEVPQPKEKNQVSPAQTGVNNSIVEKMLDTTSSIDAKSEPDKDEVIQKSFMANTIDPATLDNDIFGAKS